MYKNNLLDIKLKQLQEKVQRYNNKNVEKLTSHTDLINALKKKYPIFFSIIDYTDMQYKQFLSGFFKCILNNTNEPFLIKIKKSKVKSRDKDYKLYVYDKYTANNNYLTVWPWDKFNILQCDNKSKKESNDSYDIITFNKEPKEELRLNKEQFMQALIILFPKFIKRFPKELLDLNNKLKETPKSTISIRHLYNYLVYCGDKLAKNEYENNKYKIRKDRYSQINKLSKAKIYTFLKIFTYEQLIKILISN